VAIQGENSLLAKGNELFALFSSEWRRLFPQADAALVLLAR
jgi:hypothetical protein